MCTFQPRLRATPNVSTSMRTDVEHLPALVKPLYAFLGLVLRAPGREKKGRGPSHRTLPGRSDKQNPCAGNPVRLILTAGHVHMFPLSLQRTQLDRALFGKLKQFRAIATCYDKLARNFLGAIRLVATVIRLN